MMDHPDWPAFLAAILAEPDDDTTRLVAADFLEEHGDPDRAIFIRTQIRLARLEADGQGSTPEAERLRATEQTFLGSLSLSAALWATEDCPELVKLGDRGGGRGPLEGLAVDGADRVTFRRGFIEDVRCPAAEWLRHGQTVRARNPVRHVALSRCEELTRDHWYQALPVLRGLRVLALQGTDEATARWLEGWLPGTHVGLVA